MSCMARAPFAHHHAPTHLNAFRNAMKTALDSLHCTPPTDLNAFRKAMKTAPVSERGRPPTELNAFRKSMKTAAESFHSGNHTQPRFPESASCFQSRPYLERVGRSSNESA